jgi:hypothetical protein
MALARIKRDDLVEVIAGREKGKRGKVRSVLVKDGTIYFAAGRSSHLDGGLTLYALDAATGKELHKANFDGPHYNSKNLEKNVLPPEGMIEAVASLKRIPMAEVEPVCSQMIALMQRFEKEHAQKTVDQRAVLLVVALGADAAQQQLQERGVDLPPDRVKEIINNAKKPQTIKAMPAPKSGIGIGLRRNR